MNLQRFILVIIYCIITGTSYAQLGETFDIEKPEKYEERKLGYEKTYTKKYTLPRKFIQNTISHYNFFYNANEKINNVILAAKEAQKDSFDRLLPYYPYSLEFTKGQKQELDSAIHKATGGILLHDLRTSWVDNFYLIIGKSYLLQKKFDSAEMTFNYINYEYAPKDKDKERILTGSLEEGSNGFSIATKEKKSTLYKAFNRPPSRNESFLWLIRTYIENFDYGSAAGLIQTLQQDPKFPKRLHNDLDDITGYFYYQQNMFDSAAHYAAKSVSLANGKTDKARRNFLTAQLYAMAGSDNLASKYYSKSIKYSLDPVMEVYARLYSIRLNKGNDPKIAQNNIDALLKMAKKDAYQDYKDIIYFFAGQMELERNNRTAAITNLLKSAKYGGTNLEQRNKTYLKLAELAYNDKQYKDASNYYDSLAIAVIPALQIDSVTAKKKILNNLVLLTENIYIEDSLQKVAAMTPNERDDFLKKLVRRLRKEQGLKEEGTSFGNNSGFNNTNNQPVNLFDQGSGEWYFYNTSAKSKGANEFKQKWGNRPNVDNWRRLQAIQNGAISTSRGGRGNKDLTNIDTAVVSNKKMPKELTIDALEENLPFTPLEIKQSDSIIETNLWALGNLYQFELEDLPAAINTYEQLMSRFKDSELLDKIYFNLYLAYSKLGNAEKANFYKLKIKNKQANNTENPKKQDKIDITTKEATVAYEEIYNLFMQEKYEEALQKKAVAEASFGANAWTPQLLYLEASYFAKIRKDSIALSNIDIIINQYNDSPIRNKAEDLKSVLRQRSNIEHELDQLKVTRKADAPIVVPVTTPTANTPPANNAVANTVPTKNKDSVKTVTAPVIIKNNTDTAKATVAPPVVSFPFKWEPAKAHYAVIILKNVENTFINEVKNAMIVYNRTAGRVLFIDQSNLSADTKLLLLNPFSNAEDAINFSVKAASKAPTEIMPWLAKEKYSFNIITKENLEILISKKDVENYKLFINTNLPNKF